MKKLFIALALFAPVVVNANVYSLNCAGVNLSLIDTKDAFYLIKGRETYLFSGEYKKPLKLALVFLTVI